MAEKYIRPAMVERFNTVLILTIGDIAKRNYFTEEINQEYFDMLTNLFQRSVKLFASNAGNEYALVFACSTSMVEKYGKAVRKLYLNYKTGDCIDSKKRSVFYCLMLKTLTVIS